MDKAVAGKWQSTAGPSLGRSLCCEENHFCNAFFKNNINLISFSRRLQSLFKSYKTMLINLLFSLLSLGTVLQ